MTCCRRASRVGRFPRGARPARSRCAARSRDVQAAEDAGAGVEACGGRDQEESRKKLAVHQNVPRTPKVPRPTRGVIVAVCGFFGAVMISTTPVAASTPPAMKPAVEMAPRVL